MSDRFSDCIICGKIITVEDFENLNYANDVTLGTYWCIPCADEEESE